MKERKFYVDLMQDKTEVTGSFTLCTANIDDKVIKFAIDCGIYQEKEHEEQNSVFPVDPDEVEFVILTHNHVDHNGRLPYFVKQGFQGKIYTSNVTSRILERALFDNAKVVQDTMSRRISQMMYNAGDVEKTMPLVVGCEYNQPIRVNENIKITFVQNGHLIGAACVLVQIHCPGETKEINLFFTGDYNNRNLFFRVAPIRKWITDLPLTIITECTYGNMNSNQVKSVFKKDIYKAVKENKTIIIPVFSLGRAQEILYTLKEIRRKWYAFFKDVPIYYDGKLSFYYTDMYDILQKENLLHFYKEKKNFLPDNLVRIENRDIRKYIIGKPGCKIIVTTSGMGSYGPAQIYIPEYIDDPNALIYFTGYCAEDTLGYRLKEAEAGYIVEISGIRTTKRAEVKVTNEFSAHAKADELIKLLKQFKNPQFIMVNHGEKEVKNIFADRILKETGLERVGILGDEYLYRIDQDGFVKSLSTKFL